MLIHRLRVAQIRALEEAEFDFNPRINVIVGVNGVGKSTVLDTLRVLISEVIADISTPRGDALSFNLDDITVGKPALTASLGCQIEGVSFTYTLHKPREAYQPDPERTGRVRHQVVVTPERSEWTPDPGQGVSREVLAATLQGGHIQPLAVYFAPQRSVIDTTLSRRRSASGAAAALADALRPRPLYVREIAEWWLAREALAAEGLATARAGLEALNSAARAFIETCHGLRAVREPKPSLLIDKGAISLDVSQLSDGERGVLALVLDLTRRLSQANPDLEDPAHEGQAVVLIDELDLHLHPAWQRRIVQRLQATFPKCQFIATTHSPQILSEVQPEQLIFLEREGESIRARRGPQAYGLDSNWILEHLMDVPSRPEPSQALIAKIEDALDDGDLVEARSRLSELRNMLHGDTTDVIRLEAGIGTIEALRDAVDSEDE